MCVGECLRARTRRGSVQPGKRESFQRLLPGSRGQREKVSRTFTFPGCKEPGNVKVLVTFPSGPFKDLTLEVEANYVKDFREFYLKLRPKTGLDCLTCATFGFRATLRQLREFEQPDTIPDFFRSPFVSRPSAPPKLSISKNCCVTQGSVINSL